MSLNKTLAGIGVCVSLACAFYLPRVERPYDLVGVKFCPKTATPTYKKNFVENQIKLDQKFCNFEIKLLKETWYREQFNSVRPIPDGSIIIREIPKQPYEPLVLLLAPLSIGASIYFIGLERKKVVRLAHLEIEQYKSAIKQVSLNVAEERDFNLRKNASEWHKRNLDSGLRSQQEIIDEAVRQREIQFYAHTHKVSQYDAEIAANQEKAAKARKEVRKAEKDIKRDENFATSDVTKIEQEDEAKKSLISLIKEHEDGWMWQMLDNKSPVWITGRQGSGKSHLMSAMAYCRFKLLGIPVRHVIDEHGAGINKELWKLIEPDMVSYHEESYGMMISSLNQITSDWLSEIKMGNNPDYQIVIDEFTNLRREEKCGESADKFYRDSLTNVRKANSWVIGVTHNDTNECYPQGTKVQRDNETVLIRKKSKNGKTPLPEATIERGFYDEQGEHIENKKVTIPEWFTIDRLMKHLSGESPIE